MFNPAKREFHEWTLADFLQENADLPLEGRLGAIVDHRGTPALAKQAVLDFALLDIDFYLQTEPLGGEMIRRTCSLASSQAEHRRAQGPDSRLCIASACWRLERVWRAYESCGHREDAGQFLIRSAAQLYAPFDLMARKSSGGDFPTAWIPGYSAKTRSFTLFDGEQLNAASLRYGGSAASIDALFRFATLCADDFYIACASLLMENGGKAAVMQDAYAAARSRRSIDRRLLTFDAIESLVEARSYTLGKRDAEAHAQAIRQFLIKPLAELYDCGAIRAKAESRNEQTVLERRLRGVPRAKTA